jgi:hypothetical protein
LRRGTEVCRVSGDHVLDAARETVSRITGRFPELHDKRALGRKRGVSDQFSRRHSLTD